MCVHTLSFGNMLVPHHSQSAITIPIILKAHPNHQNVFEVCSEFQVVN